MLIIVLIKNISVSYFIYYCLLPGGPNTNGVPLVSLSAKQAEQATIAVHKSVKVAIDALAKPKMSKKIDKVLVDTGLKQDIPHILDVLRSMDFSELNALLNNTNLANMLEKLQSKDGFTKAINAAHALSWKENRKLAEETVLMLKALTKDQMKRIWDQIEAEDFAVFKKFIEKAVPILLKALGNNGIENILKHVEYLLKTCLPALKEIQDVIND